MNLITFFLANTYTDNTKLDSVESMSSCQYQDSVIS